MINKIEAWIDSINAKYQAQRQSCAIFSRQFSGFYSEHFLADSYFVVLEKIPKPNFPELREAGLDDFINMDVNGITYKNTYYVLPRCADVLRLHFHELVHVVQWNLLGAQGFINHYIHEIQNYGYNDAPLEQIAYGLDGYYLQGGKPLDVQSYVQRKI